MATTQGFQVGDFVEVLSAVRLPQEHIIGTGTIERITAQSSDGESLYWITGFQCARTSHVLRLDSHAFIDAAAR